MGPDSRQNIAGEQPYECMSDHQAPSSSPQRAWRFYVYDMIAFAENVLTYTEGYYQHGFEQSKLNYDATVRNLELIGEAATHIPQPIEPWLSGHRQRYAVEHYSG